MHPSLLRAAVSAGFVISLLTAPPSTAQTVRTIAGGGQPQGVPATAIGVQANAVAVDSSGNIFTTTGTFYVFRIDAGGTLTTLAGAGVRGGSGDGGPAIASLVSRAFGIAVDSSGNLFIADTLNARIRKITPTGVIVTVAGTSTAGFSGDGGPATSAQLSGARDVAVDAAGNLFIADTGNDRVRKVTPAGVITTIASISSPRALALDASGNVLVAESTRILKITTAGVVFTVAGTFSSGFSGDGGPATSATLSQVSSVAVDGAGNLIIADAGNQRVRRVNTSGIITTIAGTGVSGFSGDGGPATAAMLSPSGVHARPDGTVFIADFTNRRIRRVSPAGTITTVAGDGSAGYSGDGGPALNATITHPVAVIRDAAGNVYFGDQHNHRVRKVSVSDGTITTVAGTGVAGFSGDGGPATAARLSPSALDIDAAGNLYIGELTRVRKVDTNGVITTIAGNGSTTYSGDGGLATNAGMSIFGIVLDSAGNLYLSDPNNNRIRRVSGGIITTVAGNGTLGFSGDGGPATSAALGSPNDVAVDSQGNLYIADRDNHRIRRVDPNGIITTAAGSGVEGFNGDGPALTTLLNGPVNVAVDSAGNIYINDFDNHRIRKVTPGGQMVTVVGSGPGFFNGDGPALQTILNGFGIAIDAQDNLTIADSAHHRIREVIFELPPVANAGPDQTLEWIPANTQVLLDGSASTDGDGDTLVFEWRDSTGALVGSAAQIQLTLPLGTHTFTVTVSDGNSSDADTVTIVVQDTTAPYVTLTSGASNPTNSTAIVVTATFSESVTGFTAGDIVANNAHVTAFSGSGAVYSFTLVPIGQGHVAAHVVNGAATDASDNASLAGSIVRIFDSVPPVFNLLVSPDAVLLDPAANILATAQDSSGIATVTINGQTATWPGIGTIWTANVPIAAFGPMQFSGTAIDAAGNITTHVVSIDNDGIDSTIDRNRTTLADESGIASNSFVHGTTMGRAYRTASGAILASPLAGSEVMLRADLRPGYPYSNIPARDLCTGSAKHVDFKRDDDAARIRCQGNTVYVTGVQGTVTLNRLDAVSCPPPGWCYYYYTTISIPAGSTYSLGSPVTSDPANPDPVEVRLIRVLGGPVPPEPNSPEFDTAVEYGRFTLDPSESVDVQVAPGNGTTADVVTLSVVAGTVEVTVGGETQTATVGQEIAAEASPRSAQSITFGPLADRLFGAPAFNVSATSTSGLPIAFSAAGGCSVSGTTVTVTNAGTCSITASQAGDGLYLPAPDVTRTFSVTHTWSNVLQPINIDGSSLFKLGSTVPVKFRLTGGSAGVSTLGARIYVAKVSNGIAGTEAEAISNGNADAGNVFRYDAADGQYVFNLGTKGLSEGTWQIRIDLLDGVARTVLVSLRR